METKFDKGCIVRVKPEYQDNEEHRTQTAYVIGHKQNKENVDNLLQFPNGKIEPFGNWEIEIA